MRTAPGMRLCLLSIVPVTRGGRQKPSTLVSSDKPKYSGAPSRELCLRMSSRTGPGAAALQGQASRHSLRDTREELHPLKAFGVSMFVGVASSLMLRNKETKTTRCLAWEQAGGPECVKCGSRKRSSGPVYCPTNAWNLVHVGRGRDERPRPRPS